MKNPFLIPHFQDRLIQVLGLDGGEVHTDLLQAFLFEIFNEKTGSLVFNTIEEDITFFRSEDPASYHYSNAQILSVRRGIVAIAAHRIFSCILQNFPKELYALEVIAKYIQKDTNVEIHPSAKIGVPFAIDHGHGTVIGATSQIGANVFLYHGVTLGASGKKDTKGRRHPLLQDRVFCGNASQILGPSVAEEEVSLSSGTIVINSYLERNVKVSANIRVSGVIIPAYTTVFSNDAENPKKYWVLEKGEDSPSWKEFQTFNHYKGVEIVEKIPVTH